MVVVKEEGVSSRRIKNMKRRRMLLLDDGLRVVTVQDENKQRGREREVK